MENKNDFQVEAGVDTRPMSTLDPRQEKFIDHYFNSGSGTFGNCYRSALKAGYTVETARNLTHNKPKWYSEIIGQMQGVQPEHLVIKLTDIINSRGETTQNKLKAIDMLMKYNGMYQHTQHNVLELRKFTIESVLG